MKIALVFHGISHGYNEKGDITNISKDTFQSIINNLLDSQKILIMILIFIVGIQKIIK